MAEISTKPYMIRAIYEWCCDSGHTPYLLVKTGGRARVPMQHVHNGEIVLNVSPMATHALHMGNELIQFEARFNGVPEHIVVPVGNVAAIYARETGSGMAFSPEIDEGGSDAEGAGGEVVDFGGAGRANRAGLKAVPPAAAAPAAEGTGQAADGVDAATRADAALPAGAGPDQVVIADRADSDGRQQGAGSADVADRAAVTAEQDAGAPPSDTDHQGDQAGTSAAPASTAGDAASVPRQAPAAPGHDAAPAGGPAPSGPGAAPSHQGDGDDDRPPPAGGGRPRLVRVK